MCLNLILKQYCTHPGRIRVSVNYRVILAISPAFIAAEIVIMDIFNPTALLLACLLEAFRTRLAIIRTYWNGCFVMVQDLPLRFF
ncbi:MAG: hypothetical protein ACTSV5_03220 [Promethearchaeota archaeon]